MDYQPNYNYQQPNMGYNQQNMGYNQPDMGSERFNDPTFQGYCSDPRAPRSIKDMLIFFARERAAGYAKSIPKMVITMVPITILTTLFNIIFWSIINDSIWIGSARTFISSLDITPYILGGAVYQGGGLRGATPFDIPRLMPSGLLVAPLSFGLSLLCTTAFSAIRRKSIGEDLSSVSRLKMHYEAGLNIPPGNKGMNKFMRIGFCTAAIGAFIMRNPLATPVWALLAYLSFSQGSKSELGQLAFRIRCSDERLYNGSGKRVPLYAEGMLVMYYIAIGLLFYSGLNVILWFLFRYNFYIRFIVTAALVCLVIFINNDKKTNAMGVAGMLLLLMGSLVLFNDILILADDGGWSESGGTLWGLLRNAGFFKEFWSALFPALFWDLGLLFSWPIPLNLDWGGFPPGVTPPYMPPEPPSGGGWRTDPNGDISFVDPSKGTGKQKFQFDGYDENGNKIYVSPPGYYYDHYTEQELQDLFNRTKEHYDDFDRTRRENEDFMKKAREDNQKLSLDGQRYVEEKLKRDAEEAAYWAEREKLYKVWKKYGGNPDDPKSVYDRAKKTIEKQMEKDRKEAEKQILLGNVYDVGLKVSEVADKAAYVTVNAYCAATGNKTLQYSYTSLRNYASRLGTVYSKDGNFKDYLREGVMATIDSAVDIAAMKGEDAGHFIKSNLGAELTKKICQNINEGKPAFKDTDKAAASGLIKGIIATGTSKVSSIHSNHTKSVAQSELRRIEMATYDPKVTSEMLESMKRMRTETFVDNLMGQRYVTAGTDSLTNIGKFWVDEIFS